MTKYLTYYTNEEEAKDFLVRHGLHSPKAGSRWDYEWVLDQLLGRTISKIECGEQYSDELIFHFIGGLVVKFHHEQDCCESVTIEDIIGELDDLVGAPLLQCEEVTNRDQNVKPHEYSDSYTWTFYKFATRKGFVTVRWLGESNGYYSESVNVALGE